MKLLFTLLTIASIIRPEYLKPGDKVAVLAPSFAFTDSTALRKGCETLKQWGLVPIMGQYSYKEPFYDEKKKQRNVYTGTPEQRAMDLQWAYQADSIKAIFCTRGGYGAIQLLPLMPLSTYSDHPKWFIGFSDATTILSASAVSGVMSVHGCMLSSMGYETEPSGSTTALHDLLFGVAPRYRTGADEHNIEGHAEGVLIGGNIVTLQALIGTKYDFTELDGNILFIEETCESMHVIDRFFQVMMLQGRLDKVKGIIVGEMDRFKEELYYKSPYDVIPECVRDLGIPVCFGFPAGHGKVNMPLVIGARVTMDVTREGADIIFDME